MGTYKLLLQFLFLLSFLCGIFCEPISDYVNRPRGVSPERASLYQERSEFECLDGSKSIPWEQVNDDYCDCPDGTDEPGTSACPNSQFHCRNIGYRPVNIPSSRVNDFICDCCDGSDEWANPTVQCPNVCDAQGAKAREEARQARMIQETGYTKRVELAKEGSKSLEDKKAEVEKQKKEQEELEPLKSQAEEKKNTAEQREREAVDKHEQAWNELKEERLNERAQELFLQMDFDKDTKFTLEEFKKFKNQFIPPVKEEEPESAEAEGLFKEVFGDLPELDFSAFRDAYNKIKGYVREWKMESEKTAKDAENQSLDESTTPAPPQEVEESVGDEDGKEPEEEEPEDHTDASHEQQQHDEDEVPKPPYDEVTQNVINEANSARQEYNDISRKIADLESNIRSSEQFLEFEYGEDHAWAPYKGQCAELTTTQYTYKLCLFDRSTQKDRNGYSEVNLGYWSGWTGPENNKYASQKYDKGQSCWNGPERSTHVTVQCGEELQLVETSEPSKCEYHFLLKSPAACQNPAESDRNEHSEL
ncbi:glucosidase II beta subunit-like domain-containing protein [Ditylenchus destructor]|nr:glucosidase II beta subunit-like domain-containing protein [Ditylenchus destructor]